MAMELSWTTFILEIINFLILMWLLKRFFYKPVLAVIARRRAEIKSRIDSADARQSEAEQLKQQYESRLANWEQERQQARDALARDIDAERTRLLADVQRSVEEAQEKARVGEAQRQADARQAMEETALELGARFATRLLEQAAGPELEARLIDLLISELSAAPAERRAAIQALVAARQSSPVSVSSAYPLAAGQRQRLEEALQTLTSADVTINYTQDPELLAGVQVVIDAWVLGANLRDELHGFSELVADD
jgi:F-type H+-transporting ATPase subunit b